MNRQDFDVAKYNAAYLGAFPGGGYRPRDRPGLPARRLHPGFGPPLDYNTGNLRALGREPGHRPPCRQGQARVPQGQTGTAPASGGGLERHVITYPGQVTRIVVRWAPTESAGEHAPGERHFPFDPNGGHGYVCTATSSITRTTR